MKLDDLTLGEVKQLQCLFGDKKSVVECCENGKTKIVILQRGWVAVGKFYQSGSQCHLEDAYIVRRWGTSEGLGELAMKGPLSETKLEKTPKITFHELTVIATIDCVESKWNLK